MADFDSIVGKKGVDPVAIVVSKEPLLLQRAEKAVCDACVPFELRGFNVDIFDGKEHLAEQVLLALQTLPMMAQRRLIVVRRLDEMGSQELAKLIDYLESPVATSVFLGLCGKVDKRIKFFQRAKKAGYLHEVGIPKSLAQWVTVEAKRKSIPLGRNAASRLVDVVGKDLARLGLALEQLALFAAKGPVEVEHIDTLIADTRERSVFELTDALAAGNEIQALRATSALFEQRQSAIGVVMMLARHMRQLALCQAGLAEKLGKGDLARKIGAAPFVVERLASEAQRYSVRGVGMSLCLLRDADRALKGYGQAGKVLGRDLSERVIVESLVSDLIALQR